MTPLTLSPEEEHLLVQLVRLGFAALFLYGGLRLLWPRRRGDDQDG